MRSLVDELGMESGWLRLRGMSFRRRKEVGMRRGGRMEGGMVWVVEGSRVREEGGSRVSEADGGCMGQLEE